MSPPLPKIKRKENKMTIYLDKDYFAKPDSNVLGYVGETDSRTVNIKGLDVDGADSYSVVFCYENGNKYELEISDDKFTVGGSLLESAGTVSCQLLAKAAVEGTSVYRFVKKSNIFPLDVLPSVEGEPAPVPSYEQSLSLLDEIRKAINGSISAQEVVSVITAALVNAISADITTESEEN